MKLVKIKRPGGTYGYVVRQCADDEFGTWLFGARGSPWSAPHDKGVLPVDVVVLVADARPFVAWWVDDLDDPRIEVDVCLPPTRSETGWTYVDLELDPVRHENGYRVDIEDWDEYHQSMASGQMSPEEAELAARTALDLSTQLRDQDSAWIEAGWQRLREAVAAAR